MWQIKHITRINRLAKIGTIFKHALTLIYITAYYVFSNPVEGRMIHPGITMIKGNEKTES